MKLLIGRLSSHGDSQKKPRNKPRTTVWPDSPVVLVALCVIAVLLVAVVRIQFFDFGPFGNDASTLLGEQTPSSAVDSANTEGVTDTLKVSANNGSPAENRLRRR